MSPVRLQLDTVFFVPKQDPSASEELARVAIVHTYPRGNILSYHGEPADTICIVLEGRLKISLISDEGREVVLATIRPGGVFGVIAALDDGSHIGTATALTECVLAKIPREAFLSWLMRHPTAQGPLLVEFARQLRNAYEKIGEQSLLPVKKRLLAALVEIARSEGRPATGSDEVEFVRPTHEELAQLVGSSRVVISRLLKELLSEEEAIAAQGRVIRVSLEKVEVSTSEF